MREVILEPKFTGESKIYYFPFVLPAGVTIATATVTAAVYSGVDAAPALLVSGSASFVGPIAQQLITGGTFGVIYALFCSIVTSDGQTMQMFGLLAVVPTLL